MSTFILNTPLLFVPWRESKAYRLTTELNMSCMCATVAEKEIRACLGEISRGGEYRIRGECSSCFLWHSPHWKCCFKVSGICLKCQVPWSSGTTVGSVRKVGTGSEIDVDQEWWRNYVLHTGERRCRRCVRSIMPPWRIVVQRINVPLSCCNRTKREFFTIIATVIQIRMGWIIEQ